MGPELELQSDDFAILLSAYNLRSFQQVHPFVGKNVRTNVKITSSQGNFVLRYYENRSLEWVSYETSLVRFLVENGFPTPPVIADKKGRSFALYRGKPFALFAHIEGEPAQKSQDSGSGGRCCYPASQRDRAARAIANMHLLTYKLVLPFESIRDGRDSSSCYRVVADLIRNGGEAAGADTEKWLGWLKESLARIDFPDRLPCGVCHGDCSPRNFLFHAGELSGVLDLDMACHAPFVTDVASLIYWWTCADDVGVDMEGAQAIVRAYSEVRPLKKSELSHLFDALKLIALFALAWTDGGEESLQCAKERFEKLESVSRDVFEEQVCSALAV